VSTTGGLTFGYSLTTNNPATVSPDAATFPPTAERLQNYPYKHPTSGKISVGLDEYGERNMLLVLNMTQSRNFPSTSELPYSGNWCTESIPASLVISKQVFLNNFLMRPWPSSGSRETPLLVQINRAAFFEAKKVKADMKGFKSSFSFSYGKAGSTAGFNFTETPLANDTVWRWSKTSKKSHRDGPRSWFAQAELSSRVTYPYPIDHEV